MKRAFGKFQLEAPRAYKCKQILGLCQARGSNPGPTKTIIRMIMHAIAKIHILKLILELIIPTFNQVDIATSR